MYVDYEHSLIIEKYVIYVSSRVEIIESDIFCSTGDVKFK